MKITNICKLLEDNDRKLLYVKTWLCIFHMIKLLYPKWIDYHRSNKTDDIYDNTIMYYEVKDEDK